MPSHIGREPGKGRSRRGPPNVERGKASPLDDGQIDRGVCEHGQEQHAPDFMSQLQDRMALIRQAARGLSSGTPAPAASEDNPACLPVLMATATTPLSFEDPTPTPSPSPCSLPTAARHSDNASAERPPPFAGTAAAAAAATGATPPELRHGSPTALHSLHAFRHQMALPTPRPSGGLASPTLPSPAASPLSSSPPTPLALLCARERRRRRQDSLTAAAQGHACAVPLYATTAAPSPTPSGSGPPLVSGAAMQAHAPLGFPEQLLHAGRRGGAPGLTAEGTAVGEPALEHAPAAKRARTRTCLAPSLPLPDLLPGPLIDSPQEGPATAADAAVSPLNRQSQASGLTRARRAGRSSSSCSPFFWPKDLPATVRTRASDPAPPPVRTRSIVQAPQRSRAAAGRVLPGSDGSGRGDRSSSSGGGGSGPSPSPRGRAWGGGSPASTGSASGGPAVNPRAVLWVPPASPFSLLEEVLYEDPWKLLVACMLLNKTSSTQVRLILGRIFALYPSPEALAALYQPPPRAAPKANSRKGRRGTVAPKAVGGAPATPGSAAAPSGSDIAAAPSGSAAAPSGSDIAAAPSGSAAAPSGSDIAAAAATAAAAAAAASSPCGCVGACTRVTSCAREPPNAPGVTSLEQPAAQQLPGPAACTDGARNGTGPAAAQETSAHQSPALLVCAPTEVLPPPPLPPAVDSVLQGAAHAAGQPLQGLPATPTTSSPLLAPTAASPCGTPSPHTSDPLDGLPASQGCQPAQQVHAAAMGAPPIHSPASKAAATATAVATAGAPSERGAGEEEALAQLQQLLRPLGLFRKRAVMLARFSFEYLHKPWSDPQELHGIGQYGADAYWMFCRGRWQDIHPTDKDLKKYRDWLQQTGGEGAGLQRESLADVLEVPSDATGKE